MWPHYLFTFLGPFTCMCPFRVALLHLYMVFHYHMGTFDPREASVIEFRGWSIHRLCLYVNYLSTSDR